MGKKSTWNSEDKKNLWVKSFEYGYSENILNKKQSLMECIKNKQKTKQTKNKQGY